MGGLKIRLPNLAEREELKERAIEEERAKTEQQLAKALRKQAKKRAQAAKKHKADQPPQDADELVQQPAVPDVLTQHPAAADALTQQAVDAVMDDREDSQEVQPAIKTGKLIKKPRPGHFYQSTPEESDGDGEGHGRTTPKVSGTQQRPDILPVTPDPRKFTIFLL